MIYPIFCVIWTFLIANFFLHLSWDVIYAIVLAVPLIRCLLRIFQKCMSSHCYCLCLFDIDRSGLPSFESIRSVPEWWNWTQTHFLDSVYWERWYNGQLTQFDRVCEKFTSRQKQINSSHDYNYYKDLKNTRFLYYCICKENETKMLKSLLLNDIDEYLFVKLWNMIFASTP